MTAIKISVIRGAIDAALRRCRASSGKTPSSLLPAAIAGVGVPWLGLAAAAMGWRWSSQTTAGPAWDQAWLYTNMMLGATVFILWPVLAARASKKTANHSAELFAHWLVMLLAAIPVLIIAGWLSQVDAAAAMYVSAVQIALAMFAFSLSAWSLRLGEIGHVCAAGISVGLFLLPPGIFLIQASTYPWLAAGIWSKWIAIFPAPMIREVCANNTASGSLIDWFALLYAVIGMTLLYQSQGRRHDRA